jgi:predicted porin
MKKELLALTILSPLVNSANAQSSVTLYGLIHEGFETVTREGGRDECLPDRAGAYCTRNGGRAGSDLGKWETVLHGNQGNAWQ